MVQLSEALPVVVLGAGVPRTVGALQSTRAVTITASLESLGGALTLTLSDFGTKLLLLRYTVNAETYATLRDTQSLRCDFSGLPRELAQLLRRPMHDASFQAVLMPREEGYRFEVVQLSEFRLLSHIELPLTAASSEELMEALVERVRLADASAAAAHSNAEAQIARARGDADAATIRVEETESALTAVRGDLDGERAAREEAEERANRVERELALTRSDLEEERTMRTAAEGRAQTLRDELDTGRAERGSLEIEMTTARSAQSAAEGQLDGERQARRAAEQRATDTQCIADQLRTENDRLRGDMERLNSAVAQLTAEVHNGNRTIERQGAQLADSREQSRLRNAIMERQEAEAAERQSELAGAQATAQREHHKAVALEQELTATKREQTAVRAQLEEMTVQIASQQKCIAFLNRELNRRDALMLTPTPEMRTDGDERNGSGKGQRQAPPVS